MTHRTHACGKPADQCICITEQELADASPNIQRIVRNAIALMNDQERRAQVPVTNCDSQEYEDADEYEADEDAFPATNRGRFNENDDLDMVPPAPTYEVEGRSLTFNRVEADGLVRRLWAAADGPCANV